MWLILLSQVFLLPKAQGPGGLEHLRTENLKRARRSHKNTERFFGLVSNFLLSSPVLIYREKSINHSGCRKEIARSA